MFPQDSPLPTNNLPAPLRSFTHKEAERLSAMRQRYHLAGEHFERVIDERRLEFARWLVEHHRLGEQY